MTKNRKMGGNQRTSRSKQLKKLVGKVVNVRFMDSNSYSEIEGVLERRDSLRRDNPKYLCPKHQIKDGFYVGEYHIRIGRLENIQHNCDVPDVYVKTDKVGAYT